MPDFNLFNIGASYKIRLNDKQFFTLGANVYNLFDTTYISDGATNIQTKQLGDFKDIKDNTGKVTSTAQDQYNTYQGTLYKGLDHLTEFTLALEEHGQQPYLSTSNQNNIRI